MESKIQGKLWGFAWSLYALLTIQQEAQAMRKAEQENSHKTYIIATPEQLGLEDTWPKDEVVPNNEPEPNQEDVIKGVLNDSRWEMNALLHDRKREYTIEKAVRS
jgi:hypothetical protein